MKHSFIRLILFVILIILLAVIFQAFQEKGKKTPEAALPTDHSYEWIEGPSEKKSHRYFFLSNGKYFGTEVVKRHFNGWRSSGGASGIIPKGVGENKINAAYSDGDILFGILKGSGDIQVLVNDQKAHRIELSSLPAKTIELYDIDGYWIWYIDLENLKNTKHYQIKIVNSSGEVLNELSIEETKETN